ncbi:MAG TPA: helix-turn-helix transcriptional regulator [Kribbella sp.]
MDETELGAVLRARRKAAGRTIASVAVDAGLSVPYIANLENGRGNPTMAALQRLGAALGTSLEVALVDAEPSEAAQQALPLSPRSREVAKRLAKMQGTDAHLVEKRLLVLLQTMAETIGKQPDERDLDRLLDLLILSGQ